MRSFPPVAIALAVAAVASDAEAKCMMPSVHYEPASGVLPSAPVLRLFVPPYWAPPSPSVTATDAAGKKLTGALKIESTSDAFTTYRVAFPSAATGALVVHFVDKQGASRDATYLVDPAWKRPAFAPPTMTTGVVQSAWTCSHQSTKNLRFTSVAPAYRISLGPTKTAISTSVVLPADVKSLFSTALGPTAPGTGADLALGHVNCMGYTYRWSGGQWARVHALFADGTEAEVTPPVWLDPP